MSLGKKIMVGLGTLAGIIMILVVGLFAYVSTQWNKTYEAAGPIQTITISTDPKVLKHGEYLVNGPAHCVQCHTSKMELGQSVASGNRPPLAGGIGFAMGPLGTIYARNLTSDKETGLGRFSNKLLVRMMRYAIKLDGTGTVEPMMPFGNMADDDLVAVLSYLRAQKPVKNKVPESDYTMMGKVIRTFSSTFQPRTTVNPPKVAPKGSTIERGEYLARYVSNCVGCHTPRDPMTFAAIGPDFSGGFEMEPMPLENIDKDLWYRTSNITPAKGSSLMKFPDEEAFIARFKKGGRHLDGTPMAWESYSLSTEEDLGAIYKFLHSLDPVEKPPVEVTFKKS